MRTTIESIRRFGTQYTVTLACGHTLTLTADQLNEQQLYLSKKIACGELHPQN